MSAPDERAVVFTAKETAELQPVERPAAPLAADELEGRTLATVVSAGTELASAYTGERFPARPGYGAVFEVEAVGAGVSDCKPGKRVFTRGRHQSFQRAKRNAVAPVPEGLAPEAAVLTRMMGVTMSTLFTTTARPTEQVLVTGLGLVGHLGAQQFAAAGYDVLGCDPDERKRALAEAQGLRTAARAPLDDPEWKERVALVLECSGHEQAALDGCRMVRKRGEVVLVGVPWRPRTDRSAHELLHAVFHRYAVLRSGWEWEVPERPEDFRRGSIQGNYAAGMRWIAERRVHVQELYELRPPGDAQAAYQALRHNQVKRLAVVFDWTKA